MVMIGFEAYIYFRLRPHHSYDVLDLTGILILGIGCGPIPVYSDYCLSLWTVTAVPTTNPVL